MGAIDPPTSPPATDPGFAEDASVRLRRAQGAVVELLDAAGLNGARPTQISRVLGVDKTLAWKLSRFVEGGDPVRAARHLPGLAGIEIFVRAAEVHGVPAGRLDAVRDADRAVREFVERQAGDRRTFEAMLAGVARDERVEMEERRAFYRAGSAIWGVRAKNQFLLQAMKPSDEHPEMLDVLAVTGLVDLERLRPDVPWIVRRLRLRTAADDPAHPGRRFEPLDPSTGPGDALPVLPEFCSKPLPLIRQWRADDGITYDELLPSGLGRHGAVTCVTGQIYRSLFRTMPGAGSHFGRYLLAVRTPVETVQMDLFLHEDLKHFGEPDCYAAALIEDRPRPTLDEFDDPRPLVQEVGPTVRLGSPPGMHAARISRYTEIAERAFALAGWSYTEFRAYRMEMEYPPAPCELVMRCRFGRRAE